MIDFHRVLLKIGRKQQGIAYFALAIVSLQYHYPQLSFQAYAVDISAIKLDAILKRGYKAKLVKTIFPDYFFLVPLRF